jgi:hypothetical protein
MQKNNITIVVAVALTLATAQSIASNDLQITRTGLNDLAMSAQFGGANISVGKQVVPFGNNDTMMTNSASRTLAEKSYNSIVASKQFGATNFNVWLGGSKSRGLYPIHPELRSKTRLDFGCRHSYCHTTLVHHIWSAH